MYSSAKILLRRRACGENDTHVLRMVGLLGSGISGLAIYWSLDRPPPT